MRRHNDGRRAGLAGVRIFMEGGLRMQRPRFVFLAVPLIRERSEPGGADAIVWILSSPNHRILGRTDRSFDTYLTCREAVGRLRDGHDRIASQASVVERTGQWMWRVDLDGESVAVSSRSYLRMRECRYNLMRFLDAVPNAEVVAGVRDVPVGHRPW